MHIEYPISLIKIFPIMTCWKKQLLINNYLTSIVLCTIRFWGKKLSEFEFLTTLAILEVSTQISRTPITLYYKINFNITSNLQRIDNCSFLNRYFWIFIFVNCFPWNSRLLLDESICGFSPTKIPFSIISDFIWISGNPLIKTIISILNNVL